MIRRTGATFNRGFEIIIRDRIWSCLSYAHSNRPSWHLLQFSAHFSAHLCAANRISGSVCLAVYFELGSGGVPYPGLRSVDSGLGRPSKLPSLVHGCGEIVSRGLCGVTVIILRKSV